MMDILRREFPREPNFMGWSLASSVKAFLVTAGVMALTIWIVASTSGLTSIGRGM